LINSSWDSSALLAALLIGGLFSTPSWISAAWAILGAVAASWMALSLGRALDVVHLFPFSVPFVLAAWLVLYAVVHNSKTAGLFHLLHPDMPERSHERACISLSRLGRLGSTPLALPFQGLWTVSQGVSGDHSHKGPWKHALDFIVMKNGSSFAGAGRRLEDFYCYGLPVCSPAYGQIWQVVNDVADNAPGMVNVQANWGNYVVIRLANGLFALIAHLMPGSVLIAPGAWVKPGDVIGRCGNSGRSPQPHIHMHVQVGALAGSATAPFHLSSVYLSRAGNATQFELVVVPLEGDALQPVQPGEVRPFFLLAGRGLRYSVSHSAGVDTSWSVQCQVDELGRMQLVSSKGARCVAESTWAVFSCYDRAGPPDPIFDIWLLACGFVPASMQAQHWEDRHVPARLLPSWLAKSMALTLWPWASMARAVYDRSWDAPLQSWKQVAVHTQGLTQRRVKTVAWMVPQLGCSRLEAEIGSKRYSMQAVSHFQQADIGVAGWEVPLHPHKAAHSPF
jgi:hypothetical protein